MNNPILLVVLCFSFSSTSGEIHDAARQLDTAKVITLLNAGHNPNDTDPHGFTVRDIALSTYNKGLLDHLEQWSIQQQKSYSQSFLTDQGNVDMYFNTQDRFILGETIVKVNNNHHQEKTNSPKKRRNSRDLAKAQTKKQCTDCGHESTTASSSTTSTTATDGFWPVSHPTFRVVATIDYNSDGLVIGPYRVRLNYIHGCFSGFTLFSLENNQAVDSMAFNKRIRQMPEPVVGDFKFLIFKNSIWASDLYGHSWGIVKGSNEMLNPVVANNYVFTVDVRGKVVYIIHGMLFELVARIRVGNGARFPTIIGNYLIVANKDDLNFTVIDINGKSVNDYRF